MKRLAPSVRNILAASLTVSLTASLASNALVMPLSAVAANKSHTKATDFELAKAAIHGHAAIPEHVSTSGKSTSGQSTFGESTSATASTSTNAPNSASPTAPLPSTVVESATDATPEPFKANKPSEEESKRAANEAHLLKGSVTHASQKSPLMYDKVQDLPKGTTINLVSLVNINSNVNVKGDEVWVRVGNNVRGPSEVAVPGGWYMHGMVTAAAPPKRGGIDGFVTVQFDKLVSPDRQLEVPFDAHISSKNSKAKAIAKHLAIDSGHVGLGALGGSILAVQFGGIGTAISTYGISVGVGAAIGGTVGLIGAAKRKGSISAIVPGEQMKLVIAQPVSLPGFDGNLIPSAKPIARLPGFDVLINKSGFSKDPYGDNRSKLLTLNLTVNNRTPHEYGFSDMRVVSDTEEVYYPDGLLNGGGTLLKKKVKPNTTENLVVAFDVDGKQHKYWLVLLDRINNVELNRVPIN
ncbi:MAG: hypothetical protein JST89_04975 [Cyanobacteria bacterium SZAS-4]|nr:hypothetical protein [Cyanobacteria bacterium SZAS-4]